METEFTIALRRAIAADPALSAALTRQAEYGVLPNVFQFNPYVYLIETNDAGELVVTITRPQNLNPRIRYNIHDRGHVVGMPALLPVLRRFGLQHVIEQRQLDLPVLLALRAQRPVRGLQRRRRPPGRAARRDQRRPGAAAGGGEPPADLLRGRGR